MAVPSGAGSLSRDRAVGLAERLTVSFSQLEVLAQCGLRYRYMFEWRLPAPPDDLWPKREPASDSSMGAADLGTLVHSVLERFHQPGPEDGVGGIARLRALWDELAGVAVGAERAVAVWDATARRMFEHYLESDVARMTTIATEQEVNLAVEVDGHPVLVRGFIDRLCRDASGGVWVVDYKTNRSLGAESLTVYGRQLAIYQRAAKEALGLDAAARLGRDADGCGKTRAQELRTDVQISAECDAIMQPGMGMRAARRNEAGGCLKGLGCLLLC